MAGNREFGQRLRLLRVARGLTQPQLAEMIRVRRRPTTASYICRLEQGKLDPRLSTLRSLARALRVPVWHLLASVAETDRWYQEYLALSPTQKREVQRLIHYRWEGTSGWHS